MLGHFFIVCKFFFFLELLESWRNFKMFQCNSSKPSWQLGWIYLSSCWIWNINKLGNHVGHQDALRTLPFPSFPSHPWPESNIFPIKFAWYNSLMTLSFLSFYESILFLTSLKYRHYAGLSDESKILYDRQSGSEKAQFLLRRIGFQDMWYKKEVGSIFNSNPPHSGWERSS